MTPATTSHSRSMQVRTPGDPLELVSREIPEPGRGEVLVRVEACGVCHSDAFTVDGGMPIDYPRVPGHESAGTIDAVGAGVQPWTVGQRVGVGWFGGACGHCDPCRRGDQISCVGDGVDAPAVGTERGSCRHG